MGGRRVLTDRWRAGAWYRGGRDWERGGRYERQLLDFPGSEQKDLLDAVAYAVKLALQHGYRGPLPGEAGPEDGVVMVPTMESIIREKMLEPLAEEEPVKRGYW